MRAYEDQFEPFYPAIDLTFDGVGRSNKERKEHLYPYEIFSIWFALSTDGLSERVGIVDKAIVKCMRL
tara:strand:+ start:75 stop:278 length:204 start_codon:yes stop_codon:yes gene_type:complete